MIVRPFPPPSDEPMLSVMTRFGRWRKKSSFTEGEKTAAVLITATSEERSYLPGDSSRASVSGRPMASPVMNRLWIFSASTRRHTSCGSKRATR